jgi:hypothetical protein
MIIREANISDLDAMIELGARLAVHERICDPLLVPHDIVQSKVHYTAELVNAHAKFFCCST